MICSAPASFQKKKKKEIITTSWDQTGRRIGPVELSNRACRQHNLHVSLLTADNFFKSFRTKPESFIISVKRQFQPGAVNGMPFETIWHLKLQKETSPKITNTKNPPSSQKTEKRSTSRKSLNQTRTPPAYELQHLPVEVLLPSLPKRDSTCLLHR